MSDAADQLTIGPIGQIALTISDAARSLAYYRDCVGLKLLFEAPPSLSFFSCGDVRLMLSQGEGDFRPGGGAVIYFRIRDIEAMHARLSARGVEFVDRPHLIAKMPDHELWMCFFRDPDGNNLALMEEKR